MEMNTSGDAFDGNFPAGWGMAAPNCQVQYGFPMGSGGAGNTTDGNSNSPAQPQPGQFVQSQYATGSIPFPPVPAQVQSQAPAMPMQFPSASAPGAALPIQFPPTSAPAMPMQFPSASAPAPGAALPIQFPPTSAPAMPMQFPSASAPAPGAALPIQFPPTSAPAMPMQFPSASAPAPGAALPIQFPPTSAPAMPMQFPSASAPGAALPIQFPPTSAPAMPIQFPSAPAPAMPIQFPPAVMEELMPIYDQTGSVMLGPGSHKEAMLLGLGLPRLSYRQQDEVGKAKKYAMEQSIKHVLMKQTVAHQQQQQKVAMYAQALSLMARVYVGSISFELREEAIKNAFSPFGPIKSVNMSWDPVTGHHKGFAFIEYEVPEAAMLAQEQMNGVLLGGRNIKVGRPSNIPQAQPIIDMISVEAKQHKRIYVASIHQDLTEVDVKSVFEAFGPVLAIELANGPVAGKHKGYAFIDYETDKAAADAVASMNLFDLGGQHLRVGRAITPPQAQEYMAPATNSTLPTAAAVAAAAVTAKIQAMETTVVPQLGAGGISVVPSIVVGNTPPPAGLTGSVFSVPPPGVAIPQMPAASTAVVTPQLYSVPTPSTGINASTVSSSPNIQGGGDGSPIGMSTGKFQPGPSAAFTMPPVHQPPPPLPSTTYVVPPPAVVIPNIPHLSTSQITHPGATASTGQSAIPGPSILTDNQKKMLDLEVGQTLAAQEDLKIKGNEARNILMHKLMRRTESCVLVLKNMVGPEDVDDSLQDEVAEECSKYGVVDQVIIYQEKRGDGDFAPSSVKIFVKYSMAQEADTAKNALDGRFFSCRKVKAEIYDQNLFEHHDLTG